MTAMPSLSGSVGYIFTSCDLNVKSSGDVRFKDMIDRFQVYDQPRRPEAKPEEWLAGERTDTRDYLLYGRFYLPSGRLDALYSTRLSTNLQGMVAAISEPPSSSAPVRKGADPSNIMFNLQHDVGKWCTEYSWSAEDGMWGVRVLHNFGRVAGAEDTTDADDGTRVSKEKVKRVDEEEATEGGLKGRLSMGAELYFSAKERSAGVSTGIRFSTLPDATPPSFQIPSSSSSPLAGPSRWTPSQPPTTITALFNPMLGHLSGAYAARVSRDLSLASRFDFNMYSYESEWTMGAEWWLRRPSLPVNDQDADEDVMPSPHEPPGEIIGVVKAKASTSNDVSLMWEGRLRNMLVSLGVKSNFSSRTKPITAIGLELSYFSSG